MKKRIISAIIAISALFTNVASAKIGDQEQVSDTGYDYFTKLMTYASQLYIDENISPDDLVVDAINNAIEKNPDILTELLKAGFSSLDKYTEYYTKEEYINFLNSMNHTFYGIGVVISKKDDYIEITSRMEDGSAYEVGMEDGDKIIKVDGQDVVGKPLDVVQSLVVGELNTQVNITVLRGDSEIEFTLTRRPVSTETVGYTVLEGNIGYIEIINFAQNTSKEFENALNELEKSGVKDIILDLRDNPGGYLDSAVEIAEQIVPEGVIVKTMFRDETQNQTFYSKLKKPKFKFAVLVNQNTASASEVLSGAMKDSKIGHLIGQMTYGKAVIQEIFAMQNGAFKITTGHYLTRNGNEINKVGIEPDEYVANTEKPVDMSVYSKFDYQTKWRVGQSGEGVAAGKERLRRMGYYTGAINDYYDESMSQAVYNFQSDAKLSPYGVMDISTQKAIEKEFTSTQKDIVDNQLKAAYVYFGGDPEFFDK